MCTTASTVVGQVPRRTRRPSQTLYITTFSSTRTSSSSRPRDIISLEVYACRDSGSQMSGSPPPVHTAATIFQKFCYDNKDALSAGIIVAGWDKEVGPSVYNIPLGGGLFKQPWAIGGSGSTYVYGYCDATYKDGWNRDQTVEFVKNSTLSMYPALQLYVAILTECAALALAMSRDGSSGGVIRMCVITEDGVERLFVPGDQLPKFWQGKEVLGSDIKSADLASAVAMAVDA